MVEIYTGLLPAEEIPYNGHVVDNREDYISIRQLIYGALSQDAEVQVFVRTRVCDGWFWDLEEYFAEIRVINYSPFERLKQKLNIQSFPSDFPLSSEDVVQLGILNLPDSLNPVTDVKKWIVKHLLGEIWATSMPSWDHFSKLVHWFVEVEDEPSPSLSAFTDQIIKGWCSEGPGSLRSAYSRLLENPKKNAVSLLTWSALSPYDEFREDWLADETWFSPVLVDLADKIDTIVLPINIRRKLDPKIQSYWNSKLQGLIDD